MKLYPKENHKCKLEITFCALISELNMEFEFLVSRLGGAESSDSECNILLEWISTFQIANKL